MPNRKSFIHTIESTTPRRSPRLLLQNSTSDPPKPPTTPRRPEDLKSFNFKSRQNVVSSSIPSPATIEPVSMPRSRKDAKNKSARKSREPHSKSRNCIVDRTGLRRSSRSNNGADGVRCLRRSPRLSYQKVFFQEVTDCPRKGVKKMSKSDNDLGDSANVTPGPGQSARANNNVQSLRRSQRLLTEKNATSEPYQKANNRTKSLQRLMSDSDFPVAEEADQIVAPKAKVEDKSIEKISGEGEKMIRNVSITREELTIEGSVGKARNEDRREDLVKRKRKRGEDGKAIMKGWTKEQEEALQRAYLVAKPTPQFWKKVSKLVPGKSAQDCFERIHRDHSTPPQAQPRSKAKTMKSSPLGQLSLSASMLLKPTANKARRSSCPKSKSFLTQKSLRKLLQCHRKVDEDHEGDLFSVLEPDVDFSTNGFQPSAALSTPKQLNEKQGWLQSCTGTSSSSHKKSFSRFSTLRDSDLVSPPVLKQVKNRVLHEKYIDQLRSREARRRAASARVEISKTGKALREESNIQKRGVVELAKIALVSEARDAISKFQHSHANPMGICSLDEDIDDCIGGFGAESADDEDES